MNENMQTKEAVKEILTQAKESVSAFTLKIENQDDLEKLAKGDIEDLKEDLEDFQERISDLEERLSRLPECLTEEQEIQDLKYIKSQLSNIVYKAESNIKEFFTAKLENTIVETEKIPDKKETINLDSSGCIFDPELLHKIAQLEAISQDTFEFDQSRYEKYIKDEQEGRHRGYSVTSTQEKLKKLEEEGEDLKDVLYESEIIYGEGGWNRYKVDEDTGMIKLDSGKSATNTTGSKQYFEALRSKAKELGMDI